MKRNTKKLTEAMEENAFAYALTRKSLQNATNALIDGKNVVDTSSPRPSKNIVNAHTHYNRGKNLEKLSREHFIKQYASQPFSFWVYEKPGVPIMVSIEITDIIDISGTQVKLESLWNKKICKKLFFDASTKVLYYFDSIKKKRMPMTPDNSTKNTWIKFAKALIYIINNIPQHNNIMNETKTIIRLSESQLYRIIKNCVKNVLNENKFDGNHKGEAYDINSKKYKHMFDKGNIDPYDYTDYDYLDGENAAKEFLNRPNAAQDFQHFPRFSVRKGVKEYDDLANGTTRIRQYKKNAWKYKQPGTEEHFLTWWKNKENTLSTNPYEDFYSVPRPLQLMNIANYAHQYNLLRNQVAMTVMPFDPEEDDYFGDKYNEENW